MPAGAVPVPVAVPPPLPSGCLSGAAGFFPSAPRWDQRALEPAWLPLGTKALGKAQQPAVSGLPPGAAAAPAGRALFRLRRCPLPRHGPARGKQLGPQGGRPGRPPLPAKRPAAPAGSSAEQQVAAGWGAQCCALTRGVSRSVAGPCLQVGCACGHQCSVYLKQLFECSVCLKQLFFFFFKAVESAYGNVV